jgi:hypothetical protein
VQLENVTIPHYLDVFRVLLLSYDGQKPLSPEVHAPLAAWVKSGGVLIFCDQDADPYLKVHDWWNSHGLNYTTPREPLFELLGLDNSTAADVYHPVGKGGLIWLKQRPVDFSPSKAAAAQIVDAARLASGQVGLKWRETNYLLLRRGPYVIAAGMDEYTDDPPHRLHGRYVNLFDADLAVQNEILITPGSRYFLLDLDAAGVGQPHLLASACKALLTQTSPNLLRFTVEGVSNTQAVMLLAARQAPQSATLDGNPLTTFDYSGKEHLLWIHFENDAAPHQLSVNF